MDWIMTNWMEVAGIAALTIIVFERIARLTPTQSDDIAVQWVRRIASTIGLNFPDIQKIVKKEPDVK